MLGERHYSLTIGSSVTDFHLDPATKGLAVFLRCKINVAHCPSRQLEHDPEKWIPVFG
jgi:hypothetical protein